MACKSLGGSRKYLWYQGLMLDGDCRSATLDVRLGTRRRL